MRYLTGILEKYNLYMVNTFGGNEYLISVITLGLIGVGSYFLNKIPQIIYGLVLKHLTTTVVLDSTNDSYHNIMKKLGETEVIKKSRYLLLLNGRGGYDPLSLTMGNGSQFINILGYRCLINIIQKDLNLVVVYEIQIRTWGRSHNLANHLYKIGKESKNLEGYTKITNLSSGFSVTQREEPLSSIVLSDTIYKKIQLIYDFTKKEKWYLDNKIPYHLGVLLYGKPGMGKTKLIRILASTLGYDTYLVNSVSDLDKIPNRDKILVILEEVDGMIGKRKGQKGSLIGIENSSDQVIEEESELLIEEPSEGVEESTLDSINSSIITSVLNKLDGVVQAHARIIIMTTNHPEKLDDALLRPGRLDIKIELKSLTTHEFKRFYQLYYKDSLIGSFNMKGVFSGADVQLAFREGLSKEEFVKKFTTNITEIK